MIIETSANQFYSVRETGDAALNHVWFGQRVKRIKGSFVPSAKIRTELVRKDSSKIIQA